MSKVNRYTLTIDGRIYDNIYFQTKERLLAEVKHELTPDEKTVTINAVRKYERTQPSMYKIKTIRQGKKGYFNRIMLFKGNLFDSLTVLYVHNEKKTGNIVRVLDLQEPYNDELILKSKVVVIMLSIRFKSGKKLPKWEPGEEYGDQGFGESEFSFDRQHGFKFIDELVRDSHIDSACVNAVLSKFEKKVIEEGKLNNDPCKLIKDWYKSEHEQVEQWIKEIIDNLRKDRYSLILYPEIIRTFADLQSYGLFTKEANEAFDLIEEKLQNADSTQIRLFSPERHSLFSGDGATIYREKMKLYTEIIANREKKNRKEEYQRIVAEKDNDWIQDILDIIKEERVVEGWSFLYWLEPKDILARLKECNNYQLWNFRFLLNNIYNNHVYYEHFPDDYDHLIELKKLIKELDTSGYNGIKQQAFKWIERDLERTLRRFQKYEHDPDINIKEE